MLNVIVFVCGAALMALEIVAARVLAPALGNSIFVWGSVISVVMLALAVGYSAGGQLADRKPAPRALAPVIAGAGALTVLAPLVAKVTLPWAADLGPRIGSLVASTLIFFLPALLLAMVSPLGVRLAASRGMDRIGRSAGGLYAISTGGSIAGTLAASFWLIPVMSLEPLIVSIGFMLTATALAALALPRLYPDHSKATPAKKQVTRRRTLGTVGLTIVLVVVACVIGGYVLVRVAPPPEVNAQGESVLYRADSQYHRITVTEANSVRHLRFDKSHQTAISMEDGYTSILTYPNYLDIALAVKPDAKRVLVLGLGGGAVPTRWRHDYPDMTVDVVEIDPAVVDVAQRYFGLPEEEQLRVFTQDARRFVKTSNDTYDVIIADAYYADSIPFHLTTLEFFQEAKARLAPDGVLAYNVIGSVSGDRSKLFRSMHRTVGSVWDQLWVFPIDLSRDGLKDELRNIIVLASDAPLNKDELTARIRSRVDGRVRLAEFPEYANDLYSEPVPVADVPLMTDQYAPTDSLIKVQ